MAIEQKEFTHKDLQKEYDRLFDVEPIRDDDRGYLWLVQKMLKWMGKGGRLLDLACGGGFFLRQMASLSQGQVSLIGVDLSGKALEIARRECPQGHFLIGVAEALPLCGESVDAVSCLGSLEHFLDKARALEEMKRVGRGKTLFFILVPNLFWYKDPVSVLFTGKRLSRNQVHENQATIEEWKEFLDSRGLLILETVKYNGIAKSKFKQWWKDLLIPLRFSYHFLFVCRVKK